MKHLNGFINMEAPNSDNYGKLFKKDLRSLVEETWVSSKPALLILVSKLTKGKLIL